MPMFIKHKEIGHETQIFLLTFPSGCNKTYFNACGQTPLI